jgi:hypothetical protein
MVLPDGTRSDGRRPTTGRRAFFAIAACALAAGVLALGALTTPEETAAPEPSTTTSTVEELETPIDLDNFTVDQIAVGEPLRWELTDSFDDTFPHSIVVHDGTVYLFGSDSGLWDDDSGGLRAWRSTDGVTWESLGQTIGLEHKIGSVTSTAQGLIALEIGSHEGFTIWRSEDGIRWIPELVPVETGNEYATVYPRAVGATEEMVVVAADIDLDALRFIESRLPDSMGAGIETGNFGWDTRLSDEGVTVVFTFHGPLGIPALSVTSDEMGLSDEEVRWLTQGYAPSEDDSIWGARTWVRSDGDTKWTLGDIEGVAWVESISVTPGDPPLVFAYGSSGLATWASLDEGLTWERQPVTGQHPHLAEPWGDRFVRMHSNWLDVLVSDDGETWKTTGLDSLFPSTIGWGAGPLAAGTGGIAVGIEGWGEQNEPVQVPEPTTLMRDGVTLTIDIEHGNIELESAELKSTWALFGQTPPQNLSIDLANRILTFLEPASGEPLLSMTFDELEEIEADYWNGHQQGAQHQAFAFSADGAEWTVQAMEQVIGEGSRVTELAVIGDRVVALVLDSSAIYRSNQVPGFEIWTAPIP